MLKEGMELKIKKTITSEETAVAVGSGGLEVFSTPMMIALMENAAYTQAQKELGAGETTVGIAVDIKHMKANLVGDEVVGRAILEKIEGKKLYYTVEVSYEDEIIGRGNHIRYIVDEKKFIEGIKR